MDFEIIPATRSAHVQGHDHYYSCVCYEQGTVRMSPDIWPAARLVEVMKGRRIGRLAESATIPCTHLHAAARLKSMNGSVS